MNQLLCHLWGDYILQSHWMAENKTKRSKPIFEPDEVPGDPESVNKHVRGEDHRPRRPGRPQEQEGQGIQQSVDQGREPPLWSPSCWEQRMSWKACQGTGFVSEDRKGPPAWLAVWLLIIVDNILHLTINYFALRYL
jgi:hypothetical protein